MLRGTDVHGTPPLLARLLAPQSFAAAAPCDRVDALAALWLPRFTAAAAIVTAAPAEQSGGGAAMRALQLCVTNISQEQSVTLLSVAVDGSSRSLLAAPRLLQPFSLAKPLSTGNSVSFTCEREGAGAEDAASLSLLVHVRFASLLEVRYAVFVRT